MSVFDDFLSGAKTRFLVLGRWTNNGVAGLARLKDEWVIRFRKRDQMDLEQWEQEQKEREQP